MNNKRASIVYTALITIASFFSVAYVSCTDKKEVGPDYCRNVPCNNGGYCIRGTCYCAAGYEGKACDVPTVSKYKGTWEITDTIVYSNIIPAQNRSVYEVTIDSSVTDIRRFHINNFMTKYRNVTGQINRADSFFFTENQTIDTSAITLTKGGGVINQFGTAFSGTYQIIYPASPKPVQETHTFQAIRKK